MSEKLYIQSYCKIKNNNIILNGVSVFNDDTDDLKAFLKSTYQYLGIKYPKFFKMDSLSKLAFLTTEFLLKEEMTRNNNTAIIFSNNASSLDTDRKYQKSISDPENYFPSPAVFVYTLPNIGIGEISIRHSIKGENAFFIFERYNAKFHHAYEESLIQNKKCEDAIGGWVNLDENNYESFIYLVSKNGNIEHTEKQLNKLYQE